MDENQFFDGDADSRAIYRAVKQTIDEIGEADVRVTKSQIGFRRSSPFAAVWRPSQYLRGERPPLVLTIYLSRRDKSSLWKEVVEAKPGHFTHHVELRSPDQVERKTIQRCLAEAWRQAD